MSEAVSSESIQTRITATRTELEETLEAIEDKLNVPKQVGKLTAKAQASCADNPVAWTFGAVAAVVVVGGLVTWAIFGSD